MALTAAAFAAIAYARTLTAADTDFPIYFENSTLALKSQTINRVRYLPLLEIVRHLNLAYSDTPQTFAIQGLTSRVTLIAGSAIMTVSDQQVLLQNPIRRENGVWLAPLDFLSQGLAKVTGLAFRYRPGDPRVFAGNVRPAELTIDAQSQGTMTRLTLRAGTAIEVELQRDPAQRQAVLVLKGRPVDPARERLDFKDRRVQSLSFDDSDGVARLLISTTDEVRDIRLAASDERRIYLIDLLGGAQVTSTAAGAEETTGDAKPDAATVASAGAALVVAIDPGHGGIDVGSVNGSILEKDITLALARRLRTALQGQLPASVVLTRDSDVELSSDARTETANNNHAGLFISLHVGYSPNMSDSGASIFVMKPDFSGGLPPDPSGVRLFLPWYMAYRSSIPASQSFASHLQQNLNDAMPGSKFPLRAGPISVLASLTMPAVAIEIGNMNNEVSVKTLTDPAFQTRFTTAIADAVARFSGSGQGAQP